MPFVIVAVLGLVGGAVLDIYSSGLTLLAAGLRVPRWSAALLDGVLMIVGTIYVVFFSSNFIGPFEGFLITLGVPIAAWCGVMLADIALRRTAYADADLFTSARPVRGGALGAGRPDGARQRHRLRARRQHLRELAVLAGVTCSARSGSAARPAPGSTPTSG